ncbi:MAG: tetratricopeptide repeat protein [Flavobacteriaceae bacterium]|nr:tetratricopeptide repeat protein [Flavobacteriaceae bacterium]
MKVYKLMFLFAFLIISNSGYSQVKRSEVKEGQVSADITVAAKGMYEGTTSSVAKAYFDKAFEYGNKGDFDKAKKYYLKAIKEDDKYVEAYDNLGVIYRSLSEYEKAIESYQKSVKIYPNGVMAHQNLVSVYIIKKEYQKAIEECHTILKISPNNPEGYFGLANGYMMLYDFDKALVNANKALELYEKTNSHHIADGYYMVGLIHYYKKDVENAKKYLKIAKSKGVKIHPKIENELFSEEKETKSLLKNDLLKTKEDYAKYEQVVIDGCRWLMETPIDETPEKRRAMSMFLLQWIAGSPNVSVKLSEKIVTYADCADCVVIFMSSWASYALQTKDNNEFMGSLKGTESVIKFYEKNKKSLGENEAVEEYIKLKKDNKLEEYIKSNL